MLSQIEDHFVLFSVVFLFIGYLVGNYLHIVKLLHDNPDNQENSFLRQNKKRKPTTKQRNITIDDSTHVVSIKTDDLEKKYEEIGNSQTKQEDISRSINKLKNLKK